MITVKHYQCFLFQVSSGVSMAYFASVALLALAARQPPATNGTGTTYFDSVVFLTMFLLLGEFIPKFSD